jgi:hypothetical protein
MNDNIIDIETEKMTDDMAEKYIKGENEDKNEIDNKENEPVVNSNESTVIKEEPSLGQQLFPDKKETKKRGKKPRKKELIESLKKAYEHLGEECPSNRQLNRTKITILERKLADATQKITNKIIEVKKTKEQEEYVSKIPDDMAVKSLYNLNVIASHTIERISMNWSEETGISLEGWTKNLCKEREAELKSCLKEIIEKHGSQVKQYLDPVAIYLMLIVTSASETIAINTKKNSPTGEDSITSSSVSSSVSQPILVTSQAT